MLAPKPCRVRGCPGSAHGYGVMCDRHRHADRKHGHPLQTPIFKKDLKPYLAIVAAKHANTPSNEAWNIMRRRWAETVDHAMICERKARSRPYNRYELTAAQEIIKLHSEQRWEDVMYTAAAVVILQEFDPRRFASDRAFTFQLARMVRQLGDVSEGRYHAADGTFQRRYPYFAPKAMAVLGQWLAETFGVLGMRLAQLELKKHELAEAESAALASGLDLLR
ncbi:hypothetical protein [Acuticoccus kandeliae]|uniref:hypothetical protein n=1 Tax=Acuticoccus kandeliae TaxID=2073160 RepID=UPI0013008A08|nr:hypothetical protein [Acuticoccus kandeliae]